MDNPQIKSNIELFRGEKLDFNFSVDSAMFGFFDFDDYWSDSNEDEWLDACNDISGNDDHFGVMPNGAVSSSGFSDGCYEVRGIQENGIYVAFCIEFFDFSDDDEDEDSDSSLCQDNSEWPLLSRLIAACVLM
jgi:hypothetical protein